MFLAWRGKNKMQKCHVYACGIYVYMFTWLEEGMKFKEFLIIHVQLQLHNNTVIIKADYNEVWRWQHFKELQGC